MTDGEAAAYVAAFIDGEGHIGCHRNKTGYWTRTIEFVNTDFDLANSVCELLDQLGFAHRRYHAKRPAGKEHWADKLAVYIRCNKESVTRFKELIPLKSKAKAAALDRILDSYIGYEAANAAKRTGSEFKCSSCGEIFYRSPSKVKEEMFCSHSCRAQAQKNSITVSCEECGKPFQSVPSRLAKGYGKYCSHRCARQKDIPRLQQQASLAAKARWGK